ncbi:MAG: DNA-directed RNA polymerase sigma-70 factor [Candidatus Hydrogenedentota bacterium]
MSLPMDAVLCCGVENTETHTPKRVALGADVADVDLVQAARAGDFGAFEALVRRYRNDVYGLAYHFVRNREEAWDISQEVFIKAHRGLASFYKDASFKSWLLRITANQSKDVLKKRRLDTVSYNDALDAGNDAQGDEGPGKRAELQELGCAITQALESLPFKHRMAFVLREFEGMSYEEMAAAMECNLGTVMSRLHHARKKLQQALQKMGVVEE